MQENEITQLILDSYELGQRIIRMKNLVDSLHNPDTQTKYNEEIDTLLEDFELMCDLLKRELSAYALMEKEKKLPINLSYRKILRGL